MSNPKKYRHCEERPRKHFRCKCGGHSFGISDKKDKSTELMVKRGILDKDNKKVKRKKNINQKIMIRKSRKSFWAR